MVGFIIPLILLPGSDLYYPLDNIDHCSWSLLTFYFRIDIPVIFQVYMNIHDYANEIIFI